MKKNAGEPFCIIAKHVSLRGAKRRSNLLIDCFAKIARNDTKVILIWTAMVSLLMTTSLLIANGFALETSSSNYRLDGVSFMSGGGNTLSLNQHASFVAIGEAQGYAEDLSSRRYTAGTGQAKVLFPPPESFQRQLISDIAGFTEMFGLPMLEAAWQKDNDPYFSWKVNVQPEELIQGYSVSMDTLPQREINHSLNYYMVPDDQLISGKHTFYVIPYVTDSGWDENSQLKFEVWVDTDSPAISNLSPVATSTVGNNLIPISCTVADKDAGLDPAKTTLDINGSLVSFVYNAETQILSYTPASALPEGKNSVLLRAHDTLGNSMIKAWDFVVDTLPPSGGILLNNGEEITHSPYVTINIKAEDKISGIKNIYISNDGVFDTEKPLPYSPVINDWRVLDLDTDGKKTVYAKFEDNVGNMSDVYKAEITLKLLTPDTRITSGPGSATDKTEAEFKFESTAVGALFSYKLDKQDWSAWSSSKEANFSGLSEGNHYFYVKSAVDLSNDGNITADEEDPSPAQWAWTIKAETYIDKLRKRILFWRR